jgi:hypothetical protein
LDFLGDLHVLDAMANTSKQYEHRTTRWREASAGRDLFQMRLIVSCDDEASRGRCDGFLQPGRRTPYSACLLDVGVDTQVDAPNRRSKVKAFTNPSNVQS